MQNLFDYIEGGDDLLEFLDDFPSVTHEAAIAVLEMAKKSVELRHKGLEVLHRELGSVGLVEFLRDMGLVQDDYTEWRKHQPQPDTMEETVWRIEVR
ncbi:MAG: hypothetical protein IPM69_06970 [Ignavibacteria bacterium]|nr:hypothetical protein [Ignavibacteria bacterium]